MAGSGCKPETGTGAIQAAVVWTPVDRGRIGQLPFEAVRHGIADDVLEEHLEHRARLLVDQAGDALDATSPSETADGGLGDALDAIAQHLAALGASLAVPLHVSFASLGLLF